MAHLIDAGKLTLKDVQEAERTLRKLANERSAIDDLSAARGQGPSPMMIFSAVAAHLASTLFALVIGLATLMLRRNHAAIRHALWMVASFKFLVPFALLMAVGAAFGPRGRPHPSDRDGRDHRTASAPR